LVGSLTLRSVHYVLVIGANDVEVRPGQPALWSVSLMFAGDGLRLDSDGQVGEDEMHAFADQIDDLAKGQRSQAQLCTADGSLYIALERRGPRELHGVIRTRRDPDTGLYSTAETIVLNGQLAGLSRGARRFPHG